MESVRMVLIASWSRFPATSVNSISHSTAHWQASLPSLRHLLRSSRATMPFYGPRAIRRRVEPVGPANEPESCGPADGIGPTLAVRIASHRSLRVRFGLLHSRMRCCSGAWDRAEPAGTDAAERPPNWLGQARGSHMRIYEGSPRQNYEEVLRSIGAFLDQRGMREILLVEAPDGFVVQGLVVSTASAGGWSEQIGHQTKDTFTFRDDDIARFL